MNNLNTVEQLNHYDGEENQSIMQMIKQFATLSRMLRIIGAFSVVASMSVFLLQDWGNSNDLHRYYLLLSQSVLLAIGGFSLAFLLKENKGARVFFGLSLVSITANLTTLGALIFSYVQWGSSLSTYPSFALWTVTSGVSIAIAFSLAAIVLIPLTIFGFKVMARQSAIPLSLTFLLSNSMLLLPVRDTLYVSLIAGASILLSLIFITKLIQKDHKLRTAEGKFARILLFIAPIIMLVRSIWLYQADELIYTIVAFTGFMTLRHCSLQLEIESQLRKFLEFLSMPMSFLVALPASQLIDKLIPFEFILPAFALIFTAHMLDLAKRSSKEYKAGAFVLTGLVTGLSFVLHLALNESILNGIICAIAGVAIMALGYFNKSRFITMTGFVTATVAIIYDVFHIYAMIDFLSWTGLAGIGVTAIVIGSVIERHGVAIKLRIDKAFKNAETSFK